MDSTKIDIIIWFHIKCNGRDYYSIESLELAYKTKDGFYNVISSIYSGNRFPDIDANIASDHYVSLTNVCDFKFDGNVGFDEQSFIFSNQFSNIICEIDEEGNIIESNPPINVIQKFEKMGVFKDEDIQNLESAFKASSADFDLGKAYSDLSDKIIGQDVAIKKILSSIYSNQKLFASDLSKDDKRLSKRVVLLMRKTGSGKTEILRQVSNIVNLPMIIEDSTRYTQAGFVGESVEDMLKDLFVAAEGDIGLAEHGILVIDEVDKLAYGHGNKDSIATKSVQESLLKIIDGSDFIIRSNNSNDDIPTFKFNTSNLTIVLMGAFSDLFDKKEDVHKTVGFNSHVEEKNEEKKAITDDDIKKYGLISEFVGRISDIVVTNEYNIEAIKNIILNSKISAFNLKRKQLKNIGIELSCDPEFITYLAKKIYESKIGIRAVKREIEKILSPYEFDYLSGDYNKIFIDATGNVELINTRAKKRKRTNQING